MKLKGSCHCGTVRFEVESPHPYPFNLCYCSVCRKTAGMGGYAINLGAESDTMQVAGGEHVRVYRPGHIDEHSGRPSPQERHFCKECGTALWVYDPRWPELIHPYAGAVDTEIPAAPDRNHLMLEFKASWVPVCADPQDHEFARYPDQTIAQWHESRGLTS